MFTCCETLLQSQVVGEPLTVNEALSGLVLGGLQVFGLQSAPLFVLANGVKVTDFTYCCEMKVSSLWPSTFSIRIIKILYFLLYFFSLLQVLKVTNIALPLSEVLTVQWIL